MSAQEFRDGARVLALVAIGLILFAALASGITYGCDVHGNYRARIGVVRARERAEQQLFQLCAAEYRIGYLQPGCPR